MEYTPGRKQAQRVKKASSFFFWILRLCFTPALYLLYRFKFEKKTSKGIKRPCLILANHQTGFDQFAVGLGFNFGINYVATDTIFRHGLLSKIMVALTRPIPFSKGNSDLIAVKNMISVIKDGGCVGMFPSGNRCFYGTESLLVQGIGKLAKKLNVPVVLVQIRGGYNTLPRWKTKPSKGKMIALVTRIIHSEELAAMSNDELDKIIQQELSFNECEYNKTAQIVYHGRHKAEYLESLLFYCPECNSLSGLFSQGNEFFCRDCGARVRINGVGFFEKTAKAGKIPDSILEWSNVQLDYIKSIDYSGFTAQPLFSDNNINLFKAERARDEVLIGSGSMEFYADRMRVCGREFLLGEVTMAVVGVRKLTIYGKDGVYAVIAPFRTNLAKYMICGYHLRNKILGIREEFYGY